MATQGTVWDDPYYRYQQRDPYYRYQQQLANGVNIGNSGWQTALGLMLGTGLGSWLGNQYGNWLQNRDFLSRMKNRFMDAGYQDVVFNKNMGRWEMRDTNGDMIYYNRQGKLMPQPSNMAVSQNGYSQNHIKNLLPQNFDLGWTPPQNPIAFSEIPTNVPDMVNPVV